MATNSYLNAVRKILDAVEKTQLPAIEKAADLAIEALTHRSAVFCHSVGHGNEGDWLDRAGGLAALQRFTFNFTAGAVVADCLKNRPAPEPADPMESVRLAVKSGPLRTGDVLLLSSVSGGNRGPIDLALACRERGIRTIGLTSLAYSGRVPSKHPSGKKLSEAVDVVIDIQAPYGDAAVDIPGYAIKLLPVSGVAMTTIGWMLWERVMEKMAALGQPASVYMSINSEGGQAWYEKNKARFNEKGY